MISAASYLRMSKDSQDTSIPAQRTAVLELAKAGGYKIVREYADHGISGDATDKRVEFQRMLRDAAAGDFEVILCWDQDRFGRFDAVEAGYWIKPLRDAGVSLVTVAQGKIDWTEFTGRILYTLQQEGKHQFLRDLSRNVNRGKMQAAQAGRRPGGIAPFGYVIGPDKRLQINEDEAVVVRELFRRRIEGHSMARLRSYINGLGIASSRGKLWATATVTKLLFNPVYVGDTVYNRFSQSRYTAIANGIIVPKAKKKYTLNDPSLWIVTQNTHDAIVSRATFAAVKSLKKSDKKFSGPNTAGRLIFKSLLTCAHCGYSMHGNYVPAMKDVSYVCSHHLGTGGCHTNRTYQKPLLEELRKVLAGQFLSPKAIHAARAILAKEQQPASAGSVATAKKNIAAIEAKLHKAELRLVEVDRDMVAVVSGQVRDLQAKLSAATAELTEMQEPPQRKKRAKVDEFEAHIAGLKLLLAAIDDGATDAIVPYLRAMLQTIRVTSEKQQSKRQPNGKYAITSLEIILKSAAFSHS